jgi:hypothetical protein
LQEAEFQFGGDAVDCRDDGGELPQAEARHAGVDARPQRGVGGRPEGVHHRRPGGVPREAELLDGVHPLLGRLAKVADELRHAVGVLVKRLGSLLGLGDDCLDGLLGLRLGGRVVRPLGDVAEPDEGRRVGLRDLVEVGVGRVGGEEPLERLRGHVEPAVADFATRLTEEFGSGCGGGGGRLGRCRRQEE